MLTCPSLFQHFTITDAQELVNFPSTYKGRMRKSQADDQSNVTLGLVITLSHSQHRGHCLQVIKADTVLVASITYTDTDHLWQGSININATL